MDDTGAGVVRFFGSIFVGSTVMAIYVGFIRPNGLEATWAFFNLVFISHLRESKNLMFVLKLLKKLPEDFSLTVYGNADDPSYFNKCMNFIK